MTILNERHDLPILRLLAGDVTRSEALADALGRPVRTIQRDLGRLAATGLVEPGKRGEWRLSGAGQRAALSSTVPEPVDASEALAALPAGHRAVLHLIEDAVVARRALEAVRPTSWPGFVLVGPVLTGKTLIGLLAARRFGLDPAAAIITLRLETPGSLLGQRVQDSGGAWRTEPSRLLALPLVVIDEYDKVGLELRRAAFTYLAGTHRRSPGDAPVVHPTTIITLNVEGDLGALLPDSVLRRSVVLDTSDLVEATADLDLVEWDLVLAALAPVAADLTPPAADLPETARSLLRTILRNCLTARGWGLVDGTAISRLSLGRWATMPTALEAAVLAVAADYLTVSATRPGLVEPDWAARFEAVGGRSDGPLAATLEAARERQAAGQDRGVRAERASLADSLELAGTRARLVDALDHALSSAPRTELSAQERAMVATARGEGRLLRVRLVEARILDALTALEPVLELEVLTPIRTVGVARETRRREVTDEQQRARQRAADATRRTKEQAKAERESRAAARQAATARHAELQALYRQEATRHGESVITELLAAGCLAQRSEPYEAERGTSRWIHRGIPGDLARAAAARTGLPTLSKPAPVYETKIRTWYEDRAGRRYRTDEPLAWGSETVLAIIEAAAVAEGLSKLTRPRSRRREPTRRASPSSSRRPS